MRPFIERIPCLFLVLSLAACGLESAGSAAVVGKLQAEQARQAKEQVGKLQADLDASLRAAEENRKKAEAAAQN